MQLPTGSVLRDSFLAGDHFQSISCCWGHQEEAHEDWSYNLYCPIPGTRSKSILGNGAPSDGIRFALVFVEVHDREFIDIHIVELYRAIPTSGEQLVLVNLGPREIILGIVGVEALDISS